MGNFNKDIIAEVLMNHSQCEICGKEVVLPFKCSYCGDYFCGEHRLPERHNCANQPRTNPYYKRPTKPIPYHSTYSHPINYPLKSSRKRSKKIILGLIIAVSTVFLVWFIINQTSPTINMISPKPMTYNMTSIPLIYETNKQMSWVGYSLNNAENITLTGNITLASLSPGQHNLTIYANDISGNLEHKTTTFTVSKTFTSLQELIDYLIVDDLSDKEWTSTYTCDNFAKDFIHLAETKYCYSFNYLALWLDELDKYIESVESISVIEKLPYGTETRWYQMGFGAGHAVIKTTINGTELIIDPQTDIVMNAKNYTVLYEGEIVQ